MTNTPKSVLICGAGKIGRGFIGQLFHRSGYRIFFLESDSERIELLNSRRKYLVESPGEAGFSETIPVDLCLGPGAQGELSCLVERVDVVVSCVGAGNIESLARTLAPAVAKRSRPLNWLICENAVEPAQTIRSILEDSVDPTSVSADKLGLVETQVLRTALLPGSEALEQDPLAVRVESWWTLPCDGAAFVGDPPEVDELLPLKNFANALPRKLYTFNGLNAPIAYVGAANGYHLLHEAASAPEFQSFLRDIVEECAHGLIGEFKFDPAEQHDFQLMAYRKYTDAALGDTVSRHAYDSARKLGRDERLVGPATLCHKHGREPQAYAVAIASAIAYRDPDDPGSKHVEAVLEENGLDGVLGKICGLPRDSMLTALIQRAWNARAYRIVGLG